MIRWIKIENRLAGIIHKSVGLHQIKEITKTFDIPASSIEDYLR